jgi:chemosensory pili system protein ChpB (putative protein-glutamate methylesterase)
LVEKLLQIAEQYGLQPQPGAAALAMEGEAQRNPFLARAEENLPAMAFIKEVWVLAASLGGPEAVKQFLDCLPSDLPIALIYAQHTYDEQDQLLAQVLGRHNAWSLVTSETAESLKPGQVYVVPTDHQVRFTADGKIHNLAEAWPKPYAPTLDRVMQSVAGCFQHRCGTIVFTGMCDDGADGARAIQAAGGVVWAQTPESCACPAMPEAALETGSVTLCDEPEALARQLALRYNNSMTTIKETIADERSVVK